MNSQEYSLSVVVPCHNSEKFLDQTIGLLYSHLNQNEELILVENGSTDNTFVALNRIFKSKTVENVVITQSAKGLGVALKHGVDLARGNIIVFMEDDLPFGLQELQLAREIQDVDSYYIFSKYHGNIHGLGLRKVQGLIFIFLRELILNVKVKDSQATFFGDANVVKRLCNKSLQKGFLTTLELITIARKSGINIIEIPCNSLAKPIRPSTLRIRDVAQMFVGLFHIKYTLREIGNEIK